MLLLDEVFAVGDEEFQRKCFGKIAEFKNRGGTIVFVSHDAQAVERLCDRAVLLAPGRGRLRRRDARGDRRVPAAARGRREPRRARGRAARVGKRRGADRLGAAARRDGDERLAVRGRRAGDRASSPSPRTPASPRRASRSSCATTTALVLGGVDAGDRASSAGTAGRRARAPLRASTGCRSPTAASTSAARSSTATAGGCCTRSTTRSGSSSSRPARETGAVLLEGGWTMQEIGAAAPIGQVVSSRTCPDWPS